MEWWQRVDSGLLKCMAVGTRWNTMEMAPRRLSAMFFRFGSAHAFATNNENYKSNYQNR